MSKKLSNIELFELLKISVQNRFLQKNSASSQRISEWKGQDIVNFQEDMRTETKARVSEKWFYTHFKSEVEKLPRIDMLNLLSVYCGYEGWADFIQKNEYKSIEEKVEAKNVTQKIESNPNYKFVKNRSRFIIFIIGLVGLLLIATSVYLYFQSNFYNQKPYYEICFINADKNTKIGNELIEITHKTKDLPPTFYKTRDGCYRFRSKHDTIQMVVESEFYQSATYNINLKYYEEPVSIELEPDDSKKVWSYYLFNSDIETRIERLTNAIHSRAKIYRVYDNESFIEPYTVESFINFLSTSDEEPLKNFEIVRSRKQEDKFIFIKFKIEDEEP